MARHPAANRVPGGKLMCDDCAVPRVAGRTVTAFTCSDCGSEVDWPDTNTPKRCPICAENNEKCLRCESQITVS